MNNVTKKIISNFRKGLITESDMISQLYYADKNTYCQYLDKMYSKECDSIFEDCLKEGCPSCGSNYDLRCENLGHSYYMSFGYNPCTGDCEWIEDN